MGNYFTVKPPPYPRYLVFAYLFNQPFGGFEDFDGGYVCLEAAILHIRERHRMYDCWEIADMTTSMIVWRAISEVSKNVGHRPRRNLVQQYPKPDVLECSDPIMA